MVGCLCFYYTTLAQVQDALDDGYDVVINSTYAITDDLTVPAGSNLTAVVGANVTIAANKTLTVASGAVVDVDGILKATGNLSVSGTLNLDGGSVVQEASANNNVGSATVTGTLNVSGPVTVSGTLTVASGGELYVDYIPTNTVDIGIVVGKVVITDGATYKTQYSVTDEGADVPFTVTQVTDGILPSDENKNPQHVPNAFGGVAANSFQEGYFETNGGSVTINTAIVSNAPVRTFTISGNVTLHGVWSLLTNERIILDNATLNLAADASTTTGSPYSVTSFGGSAQGGVNNVGLGSISVYGTGAIIRAASATTGDPSITFSNVAVGEAKTVFVQFGAVQETSFVAYPDSLKP